MNLTPVTFEYITTNEGKFRRTDSLENLEIYSYIKCDDTCDDVHKKCRGVVFNDKKFIISSNGWTPEFTKNDWDEMKAYFDSDTNPIIFDSEEGCLLRLFYLDNKWHLITHKKLNAFNSRWASEHSWGDMFVKALDKTLDSFYDSLDKDKTYWFMVRHNETNRIVCKAPSTPTIYHVGTVINNVLTFDTDIGIPYPPRHNFTSLEQMVDYVEERGFDEIQGVIVFMKNSSFKLYNSEYHKYLLARGNSASILFRYLQVRMNKDMRERLYALYPNYLDQFDQIETRLYQVAQNITQGYINRYHYGRYVEFPKSEFESLVRPLFKWSQENKRLNQVNFTKVMNFINEQSPKYLNFLRKKKRKFIKERPRLLKSLPEKKIEIKI